MIALYFLKNGGHHRKTYIIILFFNFAIMLSIKERLLDNIKEKDICELIVDHVEDISLNENVATLLIDKRYVINILQAHKYIEVIVN
ncbi:TPA: hypothetical protein DEG21_04315 [Patescibacteria group bacterium]|nr:hypothetical protein [Candidatus Gracilibacteria bacterium]HBY75061.1 hypothetical protein [Candidatus Gracilibacteria bacterium]